MQHEDRRDFELFRSTNRIRLYKRLRKQQLLDNFDAYFNQLRRRLTYLHKLVRIEFVYSNNILKQLNLSTDLYMNMYDVLLVNHENVPMLDEFLNLRIRRVNSVVEN